MVEKKLITVGRMAKVHLHKGVYIDIPAKIDTGADASVIDVSHIHVNKSGQLEYILFHKNTLYYDGKLHKTSNYRVKVVKSSTGHIEVRYTITIPVYIASKKINGTFTLTDRSKNTFPILIGAKLLKNKFEVNVAHNYDEYRKYIRKHKRSYNKIGSNNYSKASKEDPVKFYKEVYLKQDEL